MLEAERFRRFIEQCGLMLDLMRRAQAILAAASEHVTHLAAVISQRVYEDVVRADERAELRSRLMSGSYDPHTRLLRALIGTSRIARTKNRCVQAAVLMLLPAVAAVSVGLLSGV